MRKTKQQLYKLFEPSVESLGYELLHLEFGNQDKSTILRVYIDAPGGIQVDDCETVSRQLSAELDVNDPVAGAYMLEVSSPGLDRPLSKPEHFIRFIGEHARITTYVHVLGRRKFTGQMLSATDQFVVIEVDGESYELPYEDIDTARLHPIFD